MKQTPNATQLQALKTFAAENGRSWKAALREAWLTGNYPAGSDSASLQQVRNTFGPSWLVKFSIQETEAANAIAGIIHAHRRLIEEGQKTVTAVCGARVRVGQSVIITEMEHRYDPQHRAYNCPACIVVIQEAGEEIERALAIRTIRGLGMSAKETGEGAEIRVNLLGGSEATAYYTEDPQDAINTARAMLKRQQEAR